MYQPPFTISDEMLSLVAEISEKIGSLTIMMNNQLPHPLLRKQNRIKTIQSSLAIENNTLSVEQVTAIVEGKRVLGPPNEIQEVKGAIAAYDLLTDIDPLNYKDLLKAHSVMMEGLVKELGRWRTGGVGVFGEQGCVHLAPPAMKVPELMGDLFDWVKKTKTHPLISSCVFHYEFEFIHPFADGNGRMGRLWQTALLAQWRPIFAWIPIESMVKEHQQEYYDAIASSGKAGNSSTFILFMLQCIMNTINEIATPKRTPEKTPKDIILELIAADARVTVKQMSEALGMNKRNAQKHINQLVNDGVIVRVGPNRGGHWEILHNKQISE